MLTEDQILFLNRVCADKWIEEYNIINVDISVYISHKNLTQIPVQFGVIKGNFSCSNNQLTTLKGAHTIIEGHFYCGYNKLTTLEGGPKKIIGFYSCSHNQLTSLIGAPEICNMDFYCGNNNLINLEGGPKVIKGDYFCYNNPNLYLWGIGRVKGKVDYGNRNEINEWIIKCMRRNIIFPFYTLEENVQWIKSIGKYSLLLDAPQEIRQMFSKYELTYIDMLC